MEAQTSKKQYQAIAPVSRFDLRSSVGAQTKAIDPVQRFRWALSFQGISHAAGKVLAALADHADQRKLTCFPAISTLMRETQVSERGVRYALRKLEAAGAILTERSRGRSSSLYRLMIPLNPADSAPSNRGVSPPSNPARIAPFNPARIAPLNGARIAPLTDLSSEQSKKELLKQQQERAREASGEASTTPAAAAANPLSTPTSKSQTARHTCPKCERTWPKQFGSVCHKCQHDVDRAKRREEELAKWAKEMEEENRLAYKAKPPAPHVSETAQEMNKAVGGRLPSSWLHHQGLKALIGDRDRKEVCDIVVDIGVRTLPAPEQFFEAYSQHLQEHKRVLKEYKRAQAGLPEIEDSLKAIKDALFRTG